MSEPTEERQETRCGNCGFVGNIHEMEVHAAIYHMGCDDENCEAYQMKKDWAMR